MEQDPDEEEPSQDHRWDDDDHDEPPAGGGPGGNAGLLGIALAGIAAACGAADNVEQANHHNERDRDRGGSPPAGDGPGAQGTVDSPMGAQREFPREDAEGRSSGAHGTGAPDASDQGPGLPGGKKRTRSTGSSSLRAVLPRPAPGGEPPARASLTEGEGPTPTIAPTAGSEEHRASTAAVSADDTPTERGMAPGSVWATAVAPVQHRAAPPCERAAGETEVQEMLSASQAQPPAPARRAKRTRSQAEAPPEAKTRKAPRVGPRHPGITLATGFTEGCKGCDYQRAGMRRQTHSDPCRERVMAIRSRPTDAGGMAASAPALGDGTQATAYRGPANAMPSAAESGGGIVASATATDDSAQHPLRPERVVVLKHVKRKHVARFGTTEGCRGCRFTQTGGSHPQAHEKFCRDRIQDLLNGTGSKPGDGAQYARERGPWKPSQYCGPTRDRRRPAGGRPTCHRPGGAY